MMAVYLIVAGIVIWFVWPVVLLGACLVCEVVLAGARPWLGLLPPAAAGALAALAQRQADAAWGMDGLAGLFWIVFRRYAIYAFAGAAAGLAAGLALYAGKRLALVWAARRSEREGP